MIVAVEACVKRFYRLYVEVPEDAGNDAVIQAAKEQILNAPLDELERCADPDLEIEPDDITTLFVDEESIPALN